VRDGRRMSSRVGGGNEEWEGEVFVKFATSEERYDRIMNFTGREVSIWEMHKGT
jgi:hypothetical protein